MTWEAAVAAALLLQGHFMPQARPSQLLLPIVFVVSLFAPAPTLAQANPEAVQSALESVTPRDRILQTVDDNQRVPLKGNTLPAALPAYEVGTVDGGKRLEHMVLVLKPDPEQKVALDALTAAQQDPSSSLFHQWLTPETYAEHFGVSSADIEQVQKWLESNGFQVDEIETSHQALLFNGTAAQVESAFQTTMKTYRIGGKRHIANSTDPMLPAALAPVVAGVASLHDVFSAPQHTTPIEVKSGYGAKADSTVQPEFTSGARTISLRQTTRRFTTSPRSITRPIRAAGRRSRSSDGPTFRSPTYAPSAAHLVCRPKTRW